MLKNAAAILKRIVSRPGARDAAAPGSDGPHAAVLLSAHPEKGGEDEASRMAATHLLSGTKAIAKGDTQAAVEALQHAFILYRRAKDNRRAGLVQKVIGFVLQREKSRSRVHAALKQAAVLLKIAQLHDEYVSVVLTMARNDAAEFRYQEAFSLCRQAISHSRAFAFGIGEIEANCLYAELELGRGKATEALKLLDAAESVQAAAMAPALAARLSECRQKATR